MSTELTPESTLQRLGIGVVPSNALRTDQEQVHQALMAANVKVDIRVVGKTKSVRGKMVETMTTYFKVTLMLEKGMHHAKWVFDDLGSINQFAQDYPST